MTNPYRLYGNLKILDMSKMDHVAQLRALLEPDYGSTHAVQSILFHMLGRDYAGHPDQCKSVIVEREYIDKEFASCYGRFYYRLFMNIPKRCTRLHFFSETIRRIDLANVESTDSYLGYVVVRPISVMPVGRTVLSPEITSRSDEFVLTQSTHEVNLAGSRLFVDGMSFIQQDGRVAACASAAAWMATDYLSQKYSLQSKSTIEITELATGYDFPRFRSTPGRGLTIPEISKSFTAMGYSPQTYDHPWPREARQTIYSCVESKIPAILALSFPEGHHSMVAIGHSFRSPKDPQLRKVDGKRKLTYYDNTEWVPEFIVHDDQGGLYGKLRILPLEDYVKDDKLTIDTGKLPLPPGVESNTNEVHCPIEVEFSYCDSKFVQSRGEKRIGNLFAIIAPLPPRVSLLPEDAMRKGYELLVVVNSLYKSPNLSGLVLRTYLESANNYKRSLMDRTDMSDWLRKFYRGKPMSKYIWITEISNKDLFDQSAPHERKMFGEIIMDSAASPFTPSFIALHVPGYLMTMDPDDTDYVTSLHKARNIPDDVPYSHALRVTK
ncbi:hypothetical protein ACFLU3_04245 [Chloroflexota bacterium]